MMCPLPLVLAEFVDHILVDESLPFLAGLAAAPEVVEVQAAEDVLRDVIDAVGQELADEVERGHGDIYGDSFLSVKDKEVFAFGY